MIPTSSPSTSGDAHTADDIATATEPCLRLFRTCLEKRSLQVDAWIENKEAEFCFWISSVGVFAGPNADLDSRLSSAGEDELIAFLVTLLHMLRTSLETCLRLENINVRDSNTSEGGQLRLYEATQDVNALLQQLSALARSIRQSGTKARLSRADSTFHADRYEPLRIHLSLLIVIRPAQLEDLRRSSYDGQLEMALQYVRQLDEVQQRLINANLRRRHRFVYSYRHARKLEVKTSQRLQGPKWSQEHPRPSNNETRSQKQSDEERVVKETSDKLARADEQYALTETVASAVEGTIQVNMEDTTPRQRAKTEISTTASKIVYPQPPSLQDAMESFMCPCCSLPQPHHIAKLSNRWRNHLAQDIQPYTCILDICPTPEAMFVTRAEWERHMESEHSTLDLWECLLCRDGQHFLEQSDFIIHLEKMHGSSVGDLATFADACVRRAPPTVLSCPLCSWAEEQEDAFNSNDLISHIAEHVHCFSIRSLPWAKDVDSQNIGGREDSVDRQRVLEWQDAISRECPAGIQPITELHNSEDDENPHSRTYRTPLDLTSATRNILRIDHDGIAEAEKLRSAAWNSPEYGISQYFNEEGESVTVASGTSDLDSDLPTFSWSGSSRGSSRNRADQHFQANKGLSSDSGEDSASDNEGGLTDDQIQMYRESFENVPSQLKSSVIRLLRFALYGEYPIPSDEAADAVAVNLNSQPGFSPGNSPESITEIVAACPLLANADATNPEDPKIRLACENVREYLTSVAEQSGVFQEEISHTEITRVCLSYLMSLDTDVPADLLCSQYPFVSYCAKNWTHHFRQLNSPDDVVIESTTNLLLASSHYRAMRGLYDPEFPGLESGAIDTTNISPPLYYASWEKLERPLEGLINAGVDVNAQGGRLGNALQAAAFMGSEPIVQLLLHHGADVNAQGGYYGNALQAAALKGSEPIVQLLLQHGVDINAQGGYYGNALQAAAQWGLESVVQLLIARGADVNASGGDQGSALLAAIDSTELSTVELLLGNGADINMRNEKKQSPLQLAKSKRVHDIVQLLLERGAQDEEYYPNVLTSETDPDEEEAANTSSRGSQESQTDENTHPDRQLESKETGH